MKRFLCSIVLMGLAILVAAPTADASIRYEIREFTDNTFTVSKGGYAANGTSTNTSQDLTFKFDGAASASQLSPLSPLTVSDIAADTGQSRDFTGVLITSQINSTEGTVRSELVDNETEVRLTAGSAPRYFEVITIQTFDTPDTDPLRFGLDYSLTTATNGSNAIFQAVLTTGSDTQTLGFTSSSLTPVSVGNFGSGPFDIMGIMRITVGGSTGSTLNAKGVGYVTAVPEPSTVLSALLGMGLFGGGAYLRRRRTAN